MSRSIEILLAEHRQIEDVLASLETFLYQLSDDESKRAELADYAKFFREFADRRHHGKEEDLLFVQMTDYGFSKEWGPLKVMLQEHNQGRMRVRALAEIGQAEGPLSEEEKELVLSNALAFISLLRIHIKKEDKVLFPSALQTVPADIMESLTAEFETFEKEVMGEGAHERMHSLAESLIDKYPPTNAYP